jgi:hypothetical protein
VTPNPKLPIDQKSRRHISEAKKNFIGYKTQLKTANDKDWAIVRLFYSALHLVQAYAVSYQAQNGGTVPRTHSTREVFIANHLSEIEAEYSRLEEASRDVRYDLIVLTEAEIVEYHDDEFESMRSHLRSLGFSW